MAKFVTNKEVNKFISIWTDYYNKTFKITEIDKLPDDEYLDVTLYDFGLSKKTKNYKKAMKKLNGVKFSNKNRVNALNLFKSAYALHQQHAKPGFFNFTARYARYKEGKFIKNLEKNLLKKGCPKEYLEAIKNNPLLNVKDIIFKVDNVSTEAKKVVAKEKTKLEKTEELKKAIEVNENEMVKDGKAVKNSNLTYEELHGSAEKVFKAVVSDHGDEEIITTTTEKEFDVSDDDVKSIDESYIRKNAPVDIEEEEKEYNPIITESFIKSAMKEEPDFDSMEHQNEIIENETKDLLDI